MRLLISIVVFFSIVVVSSCSNCKETLSNIQTNQNNPTTITQNLSRVEAEVLEVIGSGNEFKVRVKVLNSQETEAFPSIAVAGEEFILKPNLRTENGKLIENDINSGLLSLRNYSKGQKFNAEISLDQKNGWLIQRVIK